MFLLIPKSKTLCATKQKDNGGFKRGSKRQRLSSSVDLVASKNVSRAKFIEPFYDSM